MLWNLEDLTKKYLVSDAHARKVLARIDYLQDKHFDWQYDERIGALRYVCNADVDVENEYDDLCRSLDYWVHSKLRTLKPKEIAYYKRVRRGRGLHCFGRYWTTTSHLLFAFC